MTPAQHTYLTARAAYDTASAACESECPEYPGEGATPDALDALARYVETHTKGSE